MIRTTMTRTITVCREVAVSDEKRSGGQVRQSVGWLVGQSSGGCSKSRLEVGTREHQVVVETV